jgi:hypothetical protein
MARNGKKKTRAKESAIYSARCCWHRYWSHRDLCGRARETRHSPGEEVPHIYRGLARLGRLAHCVSNQNGGHGIDRNLLDRPFPNPREPGFGSLPGQRPPCQRGAGAQNRHPGLPVATIPHTVWDCSEDLSGLRKPFVRSRSILRHRDNQLKTASRQVLLMQKPSPR